jgi:hypothetical protein
VDRVKGGRIGTNPKVPLVRGRRSTQEKSPWKHLDEIEHGVDAEFLRPILLGESILPFRLFRPLEGIVPVGDEGTVLDAEAAANRGRTGLAGWMSQAETLWAKHGVSNISLVERWNYHNELSCQFPIAPIRVAFAASGTLPCALVVGDEHAIYWAAVADRGEGLYLASVLGSETARKKVEGLQARGQWGARHFDKVMFTLPIPRFDAVLGLHADLAAAGAEAEKVAAGVALPDDIHFQTARPPRARGLGRVGRRRAHRRAGRTAAPVGDNRSTAPRPGSPARAPSLHDSHR